MSSGKLCRVRALTLAQAAAAATVLARLARGRVRRPPLAPLPVPEGVRVSVVVPTRDEAARLRPCLEALRDNGEAFEVIVADDSTDDTAGLAESLGARVVPGGPPEPGWIGKPWGLQKGLEAATGDVLVCFDADTRADPGLLGALVAELDAGADWVSCGPRFACDTPVEQLLHPALLATLVYRCGPTDVPEPARILANGQCTAVRRERFAAEGGYAIATGHMTDDVALAQALDARGWDVRFRDASALLETDMHASGREVWREWGRSIMLTDTTPRAQLAADVAMAWLVMALPVLRLLIRRTTPLDRALLVLRGAMLAALAGSYTRRGPLYWLSWLADPAAALRLTISAVRPARVWRQRTY